MISLIEVCINFIVKEIISNKITQKNIELLPKRLEKEINYRVNNYFLRIWYNKINKTLYKIRIRNWTTIIEHHILTNVQLGTKYRKFYTVEYKDETFEELTNSLDIQFAIHYIETMVNTN